MLYYFCKEKSAWSESVLKNDANAMLGYLPWIPKQKKICANGAN